MTIPERIEQLRQQADECNQAVILKRDELRVAELRLAEIHGRLAEITALTITNQKQVESE